MLKLKDKVVIITGGAGGIGASMGRALWLKKAVVAVDVNSEAGAKTVADFQNYSSQSSFIQFNLTKHDQLKDLVEQVVEKYGRLDVGE